ncbi:hypothetical protein WMY93_014640 [Mugilogobius chulae]|uniref:AIG1-type G domain-containing protein n=1 Tax=Mugilogobius chulae TaxID=88201 RepID=A0AAW0P4Z4_9GOBI
MMEGENKRIVFLGKTGAGKSSLANTIFGVQNLFQVSHKSTFGTNICDSKTRNICNRNITLIDTPGVFDTDPRSTDLSPELLKCVQECAPGPHAFLLVLKVEKYTKQEQAVVDVILKYFSEEALKYTTVVFTHGDNLPEKVKIKDWASENKSLETLIQKCGGRCHVFDNKRWKDSQDPYRNNQVQINELLNTIDQTVQRNGGKCYTNDMLQMIDNELQQEMKNISCSSNLTLADVQQKAKQVVYAKLMKNMEGALVGALLGALLGVGALVTLAVTCSPGVFQYVAAAVAGAGGGGVIGGLVGAWASGKWSSPTEAVRDSVEFLKEVQPLVEQLNQTVNAGKALAAAASLLV